MYFPLLILPTLQNAFDKRLAKCFLSQALANDFISTAILCAHCSYDTVFSLQKQGCGLLLYIQNEKLVSNASEVAVCFVSWP